MKNGESFNTITSTGGLLLYRLGRGTRPLHVFLRFLISLLGEMKPSWRGAASGGGADDKWRAADSWVNFIRKHQCGGFQRALSGPKDPPALRCKLQISQVSAALLLHLVGLLCSHLLKGISDFMAKIYIWFHHPGLWGRTWPTKPPPHQPPPPPNTPHTHFFIFD